MYLVFSIIRLINSSQVFCFYFWARFSITFSISIIRCRKSFLMVCWQVYFRSCNQFFAGIFLRIVLLKVLHTIIGDKLAKKFFSSLQWSYTLQVLLFAINVIIFIYFVANCFTFNPWFNGFVKIQSLQLYLTRLWTEALKIIVFIFARCKLSWIYSFLLISLSITLTHYFFWFDWILVDTFS